MFTSIYYKPHFCKCCFFFFFSAYQRYDTQPENYNRYSERYELFRSDLKRRFNLELQEQPQPSSLVGSIGFKEVKFEMEHLKERIYRNLALASDIKKAGIATRCSPLIRQKGKQNAVNDIFSEAYQARVQAAYEAAIDLQSHRLVLISYGFIKDRGPLSTFIN